MSRLRGRKGKMVKLAVAAALLLVEIAAIGLCAAPSAMAAGGKYDGSAPFLCVPTAVAECVANGECRPGTAESENLPEFFKVDLKAKTIRAEDNGRRSFIKEIHRADGEISLYGSEAQRSWILIIQEKTGRMSASITGDGLSFVLFGVCPPP
jgi:hypothetical protein